jgi:hypothetical protein
MFRRTYSAPLDLGRRIMSGPCMGELWGLVYQLGKRVSKSWHLSYELEKQAEKPGKPKCTYKASDEADAYPACGQPAEYCETEPVSTGTYDLRLYWLCRQHAELEDAEKEWGDSISDLLEWELTLDEARNMETQEEIVDLLEGKCNELQRLCNEFAAYVDSMRYTGKGKHPLG